MPTTAVGDIHGNFLALEDLLARVVPELDREDTLVFLGDYIDRGPRTRDCVERIIRLREEAEFSVATLLGNHEQWMLRSMSDASCHSWIFGMDAFETIASYSVDAAHALRDAMELQGMSMITEKTQLPYKIFFDLVPPSHIRFFQSLDLFHRNTDVICVHAGVDAEGGMIAPIPDQIVWGSGDFPEEYRGEARVVYGHWNNAVENGDGWPQPCVGMNGTYGIDTIASGVLTAMRFPDCAVFQSRRYPT